MGTIKNLYDACSALDFKKTVEEAVINSGSALIDYNRRQLYERSEKASGENLDPYNSVLYALYKESLNPKPGLMHPDLYLTGAFHRAFTLIVKDYTYEVDSTDSKSTDLKAKYGDDIFGLSPDSKTEYTSSELFQALKQLIEDRTGLKFT